MKLIKVTPLPICSPLNHQIFFNINGCACFKTHTCDRQPTCLEKYTTTIEKSCESIAYDHEISMARLLSINSDLACPSAKDTILCVNVDPEFKKSIIK